MSAEGATGRDDGTTPPSVSFAVGEEGEGESRESEEVNSDLRSTISTLGRQSAVADSLTHALALEAAEAEAEEASGNAGGGEREREDGESTLTGTSFGTTSSGSSGASSWSMYVARYLTRERATEINDKIPLEATMLAAVVKALGESKWDEIPRDIQLNIIYGYVDDPKDPVGAAVESAKTISAWRIKNNVTEMLRSGPLPGLQSLMSAWPTRVAGEDVFGHPIIYDKLSLIDVKKILEINDNDFLRLRTQVLEALMYKKQEIARRRGHRVGKHVYILDLGGLVISKHFSQAVQKKLRPIMKLSSTVFPETLWTLWLINTPASFRLIWSAVRAWLDPVVRNKVRMFGSASKWIPAMAQTGITLDSLPTDYGGRVQGENFLDIIARCAAAGSSSTSIGR